MIKHLGFLFIFTALYAHESTYLFPDHHSRFVHEITQAFKNSSSILIVTPSYHHSHLSKGFLSATKHASTLKLIVQDPRNDPLSLIQYRNTELYISRVTLTQSTILVDDVLVCTGSAPIDEAIFSSKSAPMRCSDNPEKIIAIRHALQPVIQSSKAYLE
ncbi:hypothetical protein [Sulfuricurvum sp.]|uniref:hypothetical protein n=1 Tax=Sulfuricurvum sp. TaxID=2025608 RepID=UPI002E354BD5|nr:hypothetical protein [Sulfuricurvum sp.]HEX5330486.1 hypothetical protein [Sulfuricurvum sp.]